MLNAAPTGSLTGRALLRCNARRGKVWINTHIWGFFYFKEKINITFTSEQKRAVQRPLDEDSVALRLAKVICLVSCPTFWDCDSFELVVHLSNAKFAKGSPWYLKIRHKFQTYRRKHTHNIRKRVVEQLQDFSCCIHLLFRESGLGVTLTKMGSQSINQGFFGWHISATSALHHKHTQIKSHKATNSHQLRKQQTNITVCREPSSKLSIHRIRCF